MCENIVEAFENVIFIEIFCEPLSAFLLNVGHTKKVDKYRFFQFLINTINQVIFDALNSVVSYVICHFLKSMVQV